MNDQTRMTEATRLTQEGRLDEAMAVIQGALGGSSPAGAAGNQTNTDAPIDVTSRLVREARRGPASPSSGARPDPSARPTPGPTLRPRGVRNPLGDLGNLGNLTGNPLGGTGGAAVAVPDGARFVDRSYGSGAGGRSYKLYVPSGYTGEVVPLVVMLHGCTQDPNDFAAGTRMNELAEEKTFLVAYPAQSGNANMQKCWNWFQAADQRRGSGEPSIIAGITRQVMEEYSVSEDRVYVAGMSAGGAMAAIMGSEYPDLYAAVGVHSGLAPGSAHDMSSAFTAMRQGGPGRAEQHARSGAQAASVPTIVFHGDRDSTVHPRNGENLLSRLTAGGDPSLRVATRQGSVPGGHAFTRIAYKDAEDRPVVERWNVHGLGHAWSGGSYPGSYTDPKGPDASAEMVRFFEQHAR